MAKAVQKYLTLITSVLEALCIVGIIGGWSALDYMLTHDHYFSSGCNLFSNVQNASQDLNNKLCHSQEYNLELVFTIAIVVAPIAALGGGVLFDRYGTLVLRNLSVTLFVISCLAIAFSTPKISWILYPAILLITTNGYFIYITEVQTANFFPKFRGTIVNILNGASSAGVIVFTVAKAAYQNDIGLMAIFLFLAFFGVLILLRTYFLMPKLNIPYDVPHEFSYGIKENCECSCTKVHMEDKCETNSDETQLLLGNSNLNETSGPNLDVENNDVELDNDCGTTKTPLKDSLLTSLFIFGSFSFLIRVFRTSLFVENLNARLKFLLPDNPSLASYDINLFGYIQLSAFLFALLNGAMYDSIFQYCEKKTSLTTAQAKLRALTIICLICSSASVAYSVFALIDNARLQPASYVMVVIVNTFAPSNFTLLILQCFPMQHFGTLFGLITCLLGLLTALQFPLFYVAIHYFHGNFLVVNIAALLLITLTLAHPVNLYRLSRRMV